MKSIYKFLFPLYVVVFISCQSQVVDEPNVTNSKVDTLMNFAHENGMFNGTILVSENGIVTYKNAFGMADKKAKIPLQTASRFYLASVSKQFTTMGIIILKERGLLSYEDTLDKYFPEFPDYAKEITIRHMMTHTSGIPDHYGLNAYKKGLTNEDVLNLLVKQEKLDFNPGDNYSYSNGGYVLLSMIVAKVSEKPFHEFMKENIFLPLGMENTLVYDESDPKVEHRAIGYNGMNELDDYEIYTTGAGGMYSTIDDLFKWDQALYTEKLISKNSLDEAFSKATLNNNTTSSYGFGWGISGNKENLIVEHSGGMNGYRTYFRRYLKDNNAFIILTNNGNAVEMGGINSALNNILSGTEFSFPKIPFTNLIIRAFEQNDIDTAIDMAKNQFNEHPERYKRDETNINNLGYSLMEKNLEGAISVFKLNTTLNPSSSNVFDSYGEALLKKGDTLIAIENYKKSIALNPNNTNGIDVLTNKLGLAISEILPNISISNEVLESYTGKYELNPNFVLTIIREGSRMYIHPTGQSKTEIFPASEIRFFSKVVDAQLTFNKDSSGQVVGLTLHQGGDMQAKKID